MNDNGEAQYKPVHNERIKVTATYLHTADGGLFTAGVVAPLVAAVVGLGNATGNLSALTLVLGIAIFLRATGALHVAGRSVLNAFEP